MQTLVAYYLAFVTAFWPDLTRYQRREVSIIVRDVASTDATPREGLRLVNIAAAESSFDTRAVGRHGELVAKHVDRADLWFMGHEPPRA